MSLLLALHTRFDGRHVGPRSSSRLLAECDRDGDGGCEIVGSSQDLSGMMQTSINEMQNSTNKLQGCIAGMQGATNQEH